MKQKVNNMLCLVLTFCMSFVLMSCGKSDNVTEDGKLGASQESGQVADSAKDVQTPNMGTGLVQNSEGYYEIASAEDFMAFSELLETYIFDHWEGSNLTITLPQNVILTTDIDLSAFCGVGNSLMPFGGPFIVELNGNKVPILGQYGGTFNGNGHTISGIYMDAEELGLSSVAGLGLSSVGLFADVHGARVFDLTISDSTFKGNTAGSIAAMAGGSTIEHCVIAETVSVTAPDNPGGLAGGVVGSIADGGVVLLQCENYGHIDAYWAGGLLGYVSDNTYAVQCDNYGTVTGTYAGGIISHHGGSSYYDGLVCGCINYGEVSGTETVAGIVADNRSTIRYCINAGTVTGSRANAIANENGSTNGCGNVGTIYSQNPGYWSSAILFMNSWDMGVYEGIEAEELANIHGYTLDKPKECTPIGASALTNGTLIAVYSETEFNDWVQGENYPVWDGVGGLEEYDLVRAVMGIQ